MKILHTKTLKNGKRHAIVEMDEGENILCFNEKWHYRLGGQVDDVVQGHVITESDHVVWCSIEQRWVA